MSGIVAEESYDFSTEQAVCGAVMSTRMDANLMCSVLPASSVDRYSIKYAPSAAMVTVPSYSRSSS